MTLPFLPNKLFIAIAEQTSELGTLLSPMLSNKALSTLLAPVLLLKTAQSSVVSNGKTALEHAVSRGDLKLAESMLAASTLRINERDINCWTLPDIVIRNRHTGLIQLLLTHGADVAMQSPRYNWRGDSSNYGSAALL
jgi:ankyrin repeat protein